MWSDADVADAAVKLAAGAFGSADQRCTANRRLIVAADRAEELLERFLAATGELGWGDPLDPATRIGPLVSVAACARVAGVVERARPAGAEVTTAPAHAAVGAPSITTLLPASPKLLVNAEIDDYGVLDEHPCGCDFQAPGLVRHLHTIRSFEKLTSEGMSFLGADLLHLVEEVLPARFGGDGTRYQIVEEEREGLPVVEIRVHPDVGAVDERELVAAALDALAAISAAHRG